MSSSFQNPGTTSQNAKEKSRDSSKPKNEKEDLFDSQPKLTKIDHDIKIPTNKTPVDETPVKQTPAKNTPAKMIVNKNPPGIRILKRKSSAEEIPAKMIVNKNPPEMMTLDGKSPAKETPAKMILNKNPPEMMTLDGKSPAKEIPAKMIVNKNLPEMMTLDGKSPAKETPAKMIVNKNPPEMMTLDGKSPAKETPGKMILNKNPPEMMTLDGKSPAKETPAKMIVNKNLPEMMTLDGKSPAKETPAKMIVNKNPPEMMTLDGKSPAKETPAKMIVNKNLPEMMTLDGKSPAKETPAKMIVNKNPPEMMTLDGKSPAKETPGKMILNKNPPEMMTLDGKSPAKETPAKMILNKNPPEMMTLDGKSPAKETPAKMIVNKNLPEMMTLDGKSPAKETPAKMILNKNPPEMMTLDGKSPAKETPAKMIVNKNPPEMMTLDGKSPAKETPAKMIVNKNPPEMMTLDGKSPDKKTLAITISDINTPIQTTSTNPSLSLLVNYQDGKKLKLNLDTSYEEYKELFIALEKIKPIGNDNKTPAEKSPDNKFPTPTSSVKKREEIIALAKNIPVLETEKLDQIMPVTPVVESQDCLVNPGIVKTNLVASDNKSTGEGTSRDLVVRNDASLVPQKLPIKPILKKGWINGKPYLAIFKGLNLFIDYGSKYTRTCVNTLKYYIISLGGEIEKYFNRKVTHVVFCDGLPKTYDIAISRNIPLVSSKWVKNSILSNRLLDTVNYPAINLEKYSSRPQKTKFKYNFQENKLLLKSDLHKLDKKKRVEICLAECIDFINGIMNTPKIRIGEEYDKKLTIETTQQGKSIDEKVVTTPPTTSAPNESEMDDQETKPSPLLINVINTLAVHLLNVYNSDRKPRHGGKKPMRFAKLVELFKTVLKPGEKEKELSPELNLQLIKIEDYLQLNFENKQKLRKVLFPSLYPDLLNIDSEPSLTLEK